jgi:hypothetical protein
MNERFVYHASLAFCIGLAYFLIKNPIFNDKNKQIIAAAVASVFIVFFSFLTLKRIPDWRNNDTLNASAIKTSPNSARANCFYGVTIWENAFMKLPKDASNEQKKVVLDSLKPYFERSLSILPNYGSALKMWVGISGEYYKIDNNLETLIQEFRRANLNGLYEPFVLEFLEYVNGRIVNKEDADKMIQFYTEMIDFYKKTQAKTILPGKYELYLKQMQERRARLN